MSESILERNLLTGYLALHLGLLEREQFVSAMGIWVNERETLLADIFVRQGALDAQSRGILDDVVARNLARHEGDIAQSMAGLRTATANLLEDFADLQSSDPENSLSLFAWSMPGAATAQTRPAEKKTPAEHDQAGARFRIVRPHARGGLGEVFVAQDQEVPREVALKQIHSRHADDSRSRARFVLEAEITGALEHPGIVPVYGLGTYPDGRPYYAMRFIRGTSLRYAIKQFHMPLPGEEVPFDPGKDLASLPVRRLRLNEANRARELRQLLGRFVAVCQTIAYSHSRGVLHRDLKPDNIMLGKFGETLLVDWGLAKAGSPANSPADPHADPQADPHADPQAGPHPVPRTGPQTRAAGTLEFPVPDLLSNSEPLLSPGLKLDSEPTQPGEFLGTLAYSSPEQARGQWDSVRATSDIYSLGATLYAILTGQAPHQGRESREVYQKAISGDIPRPRAIVADVPPALEAICLQALAFAPEDRYQSAQALAEDVESYLADEPVSAYSEPWLSRLRRSARKRPSLTAALVATILVGLLGTGVFNMLLRFKNDELAQANANYAQANDNLKRARDEAQANLKTAQDARALAESRGQEAFQQKSAADAQRVLAEDNERLAQKNAKQAQDEQQRTEQALEFLVSTFRRPDPTQDGRELRVLDLLMQTEQRLDQAFPDARIRLRLLMAIQRTYAGLGIADRAVFLAERYCALATKLLGPDHPETFIGLACLANAFVAAQQPQRAVPILEALLSKQQVEVGPEDPNTLGTMNNLALALRAAGHFDKSIELQEFALEKQTKFLGPEHPATLGSLNNLATAYRMAGQNPEKSLPLQLQAFEGQKKVLGPDHPDTLGSMDNLAQNYAVLNNFTQALPLFEEAFKLRTKRLGAEHPYALGTQINFGRCLFRAGRFDAGETMLLSATDTIRRLDPRKHAGLFIAAHRGLIDLYTDWNKPEQAATYRAALEEFQTLK